MASPTSPSSSSSTSGSFHTPDPPIILPEDYGNNGRPSSSSSRVFLSSTPARDSTIEVQSLQHEYQLHVRLPGFNWDGITLATKKQRVLHVVADRWDNGGGHFERRVAFGYDADLAQVKADFNGEVLRIKIPRRISMVTSLEPSTTIHTPAGRPS